MSRPMSTSSRGIFAAIACLGLLALLVFLISSKTGNAKKQHRAEPGTTNDNSLKAEVESLKKMVYRLDVRNTRQKTAARGDKTSTTSDDYQRQTSRRPKRKQMTDAEQRDFFSGFAASEERDSSWAANKENEIKSVFLQRKLARLVLKSVSCRKTMCHVDIQFSDSAHKQTDLRMLHRHPPFDQAAYVAMNSYDDLDVSIFIKRFGAPWPTPP